MFLSQVLTPGLYHKKLISPIMVLFLKALVVIAKASTYTAVCLKKGAIIVYYTIYTAVQVKEVGPNQHIWHRHFLIFYKKLNH